jgi:glucokinase
MKYILGVDIGGTKCAVVLGKYEGGIEILDKIKFPSETDKGPENTINNLFQAVVTIIGRNNLTNNDIASIGISCGGPLDSKNGIIMSPPNLKGWDNIAIVERFESRFGIKTKLQNDANACALAEWKFGAANGYDNAIFLTFGTGLGAGLILDGRLYTGANDMAGEVGHIRLEQTGPVGYGKAGSFEGFCSGGGIAQLAKIKVLEKFQRGGKGFLL